MKGGATMQIYKLYGCGMEYIKESELRLKFERNKANCPNGWASEYANFEDYLTKGKAGNWLVLV